MLIEFNRVIGLDRQDFVGMALEARSVEERSRLGRALYHLLGLSGEVGELQNQFKKLLRGNPQFSVESGLELRDEVADVYAYLSLATEALGIDPELALAAKVVKNYLRFPRSIDGDRTGGATLIVFGPACTGKSTLTASLSDSFRAYVEDTRGNPHVQSMIAGDTFDAFALQLSLVARLQSWLASTDPRDSIVIDQHPAVMGLVYSELWHQKGLLSDSEYTDVLQNVASAIADIERRSGPQILVQLRADPAQCRQRHLQRDGHAPELEWFENIVSLTDALVDGSEREIARIDTTNTGRAEVFQQVGMLVSSFRRRT